MLGLYAVLVDILEIFIPTVFFMCENEENDPPATELYDVATSNRLYSSGNFAPVAELDEAVLPSMSEADKIKLSTYKELLGGAYVRIGPNPKFPPGRREPYHWFDGDGMLHACHIKEDEPGHAHVLYTNAFVKTFRYKAEAAVQKRFAPNLLGGLVGPKKVIEARMLKYFWKTWTHKPRIEAFRHGISTANTSVVFFNDQVLCLNEGDLPYWVHIGTPPGERPTLTIETVGRINPFSPMREWHSNARSVPFFSPFSSGGHAVTAHPKLVAVEQPKGPPTTQLHMFGWDVSGVLHDHLRYTVLGEDGELLWTTPIKVDRGLFIHDFVVTAKGKAVFVENPLKFEIDDSLGWGELPFKWMEEPMSLLVYDSKNRGNAAQRYTFAGDLADQKCRVIMHYANGWEEENGYIKVLAMGYEKFDMLHMERNIPMLFEIVMDPGTNTFTETAVQTRTGQKITGEFPVIRPDKTGRRCDYVYVSRADDSQQDNFHGIWKVYLPKWEVKCVVFEEVDGMRGGGGEVTFVPKEGDAAEDSGYLLTIWTPPRPRDYTGPLGPAHFLVYDACSLEALMDIDLGRQVPHGLHGTFLTKSQLEAATKKYVKVMKREELHGQRAREEECAPDSGR